MILLCLIPLIIVAAIFFLPVLLIIGILLLPLILIFVCCSGLTKSRIFSSTEENQSTPGENENAHEGLLGLITSGLTSVRVLVGRVLVKTRDISENLHLDEKLALIKEKAQPYTKNVLETASNAVDSVKNRFTNLVNHEKFEELYNSYKSGNLPFAKYFPSEVLKEFIEKAMASNIEPKDVTVVLKFISYLIPGADVVERGGRVMINLVDRSEDITEMVRKLQDLVAARNFKEAAKEMYGLIKRFGSFKDLVERIRKLYKRD